jgi:hypothetical protein
MDLEGDSFEITAQEKNFTRETKRHVSVIFFLDDICGMDKARPRQDEDPVHNSSMVEQKTSCVSLNVTVNLSLSRCVTTYYVTISLHIPLLTSYLPVLL